MEDFEINDYRCYEILGLPYGASLKEVKKAYKRLVCQWHPHNYFNDKKPEAVEKINEIILAYYQLKRVLNDPDKIDSDDDIEKEVVDMLIIHYYGPGYDPMMDFWESEEHYNSVVRPQKDYFTFQYNVFDESSFWNVIIQVIMIPLLIVTAIYIVYHIICLISGVVILLLSLTLVELIYITLFVVLIVYFKEINQSLTKLFQHFIKLCE